ncbi:hypothetical protein HZB96_03190 [Candidatus Gottesmanbacteria bacterium]|nr:hypothetical protein [Candidatus Gottesmanbacteria bacterium]MBI5452954.1 hypothetical protein [Candidatus Gottesmanbacteria bacterium]
MRSNPVIRDATYKVIGSLVDLLIWQVALVGASVGKKGSRGVYKAFQEADQILEKVNSRSLVATWHQIFKKNLLTYKKRQNLYSPQITEYGKKRLNEIIPSYQKLRPWDKRIYLITYDIPEEKRVKRDLLRSFLLRLNSRLIQESTYINIYNPRKLLSDYVSEHNIPGTIIISDIGQDGGIGETTIQDFLVRTYSLEKLNERYEDFINNAKSKSSSYVNILFEYLSILKDDPQLPFELLPKGWLGDKAYAYYMEIKKIYINSYAAA